VSGTVRIAGPLAEPASLLVEPQITSAALQLFDYDLENDGPIHLTYSDDVLSINTLKLKGTDTNLTITGSASHAARSLDLRAEGDANLAILQAFKGFGELRLGGGATLKAQLDGDFDHLRFTGQATVHDGRIRFPSLSRSLDGIQGPITFENGDLNFDGLKGKMGGGDIKFGGVLRFDGFHPVEYQLTAHGTTVQVRYPEGFETTANADLSMSGPVAQPTLGGNVEITRVRYLRPLSTDVGLLAFGAAGGSGGSTDVSASTPASADQTDISLAYDIHVHAGSMPFIETKDITVYGSTDNLTVRGTVNQPIVTGRLDLERGDFFFNGNRLRLVAGSIDFPNPLRTEPFFDVTATTQAHVQQETFNITGRVTGSPDISCGTGSDCQGRVPKMTISLHSDPYLSDWDIETLLLGGTTDPGTIQQRNLNSPQAAQAQLIQTMATQIVTAPISSRVGSFVGAVIPLDTIQFVPLLGLDPTVGSGTNTSARVTLGKAVSDKIYLTYSRDVTTAVELILLEYAQNDRVSWVLSRNEDHTFALDFRIRHIF
jgi:translocation and assembly module TamB